MGSFGASNKNKNKFGLSNKIDRREQQYMKPVGHLDHPPKPSYNQKPIEKLQSPADDQIDVGLSTP